MADPAAHIKFCMKTIIVLFLNCLYLVTAAQDSKAIHTVQDYEKKALLISPGKPHFTDAFTSKRNISLSMSYQYRFMKSFSLEPFYLYAQNNSYPSFFNDEEKLDKFIRSMEDPEMFYIYANWDEIYTHSLGLRFHFSFVHNPRWYFSFNFATGYYLSLSSIHSLSFFEYTFPPYQITNYGTDYYRKWNRGLFIMPGILLNYSTKNRYIFGLHLTGYFFNEKKDWSLEDMPVLPNHWNASLVLGKAF
jgi:hypothetical protein